MLLELKVRDFAIIDNVHLTFGGGLNIMSGETGAGKSVLLKSLALLMGGKVSSDMVRTGTDQAVVEGSFDVSKRPDITTRLSEMGLEDGDGTLIVRRLVNREGKNRIYINGGLAPLQSLQDLVAPLIEMTSSAVPLIEMTGQHENRNLLSKTFHTNILDSASETWVLRKNFSEKWTRLQKNREEKIEIEASERTRVQRLDFLTYQRDEIRSASPRTGEDVEIENDFQRLKNASLLSQWAQMSESTLYGEDDSVLVRLHKVLQKASELSAYDTRLQEKTEALRQAKTLIEDSVYEIRAYGEDLEAQPEQLDQMEKRRSDLKQLQKKYGPTLEDVVATLNRIEEEIRTLESSSERLGLLKAEHTELMAALKKLGEELHKKRQKGCEKLVKQVNSELESLNMKGVELFVKLTALAEPISTGFSDVEFMTRVSKKEEPRPLGKTASGGELSRILLVLKEVVGQSDLPRTYLFDEVDTGVSGPTAEKVGRKLRSIAKGQQVICVTHLPQVASFGDLHFLIEKNAERGSVHTEVRELKKSDRVREIARLISGEKITKTSIAHAEQLLDLH